MSVVHICIINIIIQGDEPYPETSFFLHIFNLSVSTFILFMQQIDSRDIQMPYAKCFPCNEKKTNSIKKRFYLKHILHIEDAWLDLVYIAL